MGLGQREQSSKDWGKLLLPCTGQLWARGGHTGVMRHGGLSTQPERDGLFVGKRPLRWHGGKDAGAASLLWCPSLRGNWGLRPVPGSAWGAEGREETWQSSEQGEGPSCCSPSPVPLPQQHSPEPTQGPRPPGSAARTAAPCTHCSAPPPRPRQCSRSGMGWTGYSAGPGGPAWLEKEQGRELERCHGGWCIGPWPHMQLLKPRAVAEVLGCLR